MQRNIYLGRYRVIPRVPWEKMQQSHRPKVVPDPQRRYRNAVIMKDRMKKPENTERKTPPYSGRSWDAPGASSLGSSSLILSVSRLMPNHWISMTNEYCLCKIPSPPFSRSTLKM